MKTLLLKDEIKKPPHRKLRGYAFDPSLSLKLDTVEINDIIYKVPWEDVTPGPVGEYIEVIDYDPALQKFYMPVDLNNPYIIATDGLEPSESNPRFHQQMVYAVAMTTIKNFERALGRKILWAPRELQPPKPFEIYIQRLRIYPHALREANAFYSPVKKALLFGFFTSVPVNESIHMPGSLVFTCLSHDIITHETTHAILDGLHTLYNEPTNPDVLAFHEAFADIVALFQHFTFPNVLKHQIAKTRGDLSSQNLLGQLAQEFGSAIGSYGSLRDALGSVDPKTDKWNPTEPSPEDYQTIMQPHARGSLLVAAIFEAFINIYKSRVGDLLRIASNGSGILPAGDLHPDLVNRLANEASKAAGHVLNMCIRALDYCPPIDITFGDYLRAIITADVDLVIDDSRDYRLAFIDAFRRRGIYPQGIKTLSVESLAQPQVNLSYETNTVIVSSRRKVNVDESTGTLLKIVNEFLRDYGNSIKYVNDRRQIFDKTREYIAGGNGIQGLHERLNIKFSNSNEFERITGLAFVENPEHIGVRKLTGEKYQGPSFRIQNLRLVTRVGPNGNQINHVVFSIIQRSGVIMKDGIFQGHFTPLSKKDIQEGKEIPPDGFEFKGGCTLIFDLDTLQLKYAITKPLLEIQNNEVEPRIDLVRAKKQNDFQTDMNFFGVNEYTHYFSSGVRGMTEPFCFLHQH